MMDQLCNALLRQTFDNWDEANILCIPGVMLQLRLADDSDAEYRIHWIKDCNETYVHNHKYGFYSLCLEGGYIEKGWSMMNSPGKQFYRFIRGTNNVLGEPDIIPGILVPGNTRCHYPGNLLYVPPTRFHSIHAEKSNEAVTFVVRMKKEKGLASTLSNTEVIDAPTEISRPANAKERLNLRHKLESILNRY